MPRSRDLPALAARRAAGRAGTVRLLLGAAALLIPVAPGESASLAPSRSGLLRQVRAAEEHSCSYHESDREIEEALAQGRLVHLPGNRDYEVKETVRRPYARPEVRRFVEGLAATYRSRCGERLMVTSLVRPRSEQPRNASPLSVHPTGMALDLRISTSWRCRSWLEAVLLDLEEEGILEAARERRPPHYHAVLFPDPYLRTVEAGEEVALFAPSAERYRVRPGDSLWAIARRYRTSVERLRRENGLRSTTIRPGQVLTVPTR